MSIATSRVRKSPESGITDIPRERLDRVSNVIGGIARLVPPVWPLEDYVAVNPFVGLAGARFLDARRLLRSVRDCEMLLPASHFYALHYAGAVTTADIENAFRQCLEEYPDLYCGLDPRKLVASLEQVATSEASKDSGDDGRTDGRRYHTVTEAVDRLKGGSWTSHVVTDISRFCAAHHDLGQAAWQSPWRHLPLYEAWRESARISRRMELLGIRGFREFVQSLPDEPEAAVAALLEKLGVPERHWRAFLLCELLSVGGWASYLAYRVWQASAADSGSLDEHIVALLAIRLAYDAALAMTDPLAVAVPGCLYPSSDEDEDDAGPTGGHEDASCRYLFQIAAEVAHRRRLFGKLVGEPVAGGNPSHGSLARDAVQMVFCIDVRSEVFRRHLESQDAGIRTFGFAGFFGTALELVPLGATSGPAQCPVLLQPTMRAHERLERNGVDVGEDGQASAVRRRRLLRLSRKGWKAFQSSATSCFSFVESLGVFYLAKLVSDSLGWTRPVARSCHDGLPVGRARLVPRLPEAGPDAVPLGRRVDLAAGILRNLGLTERFARVVVFCGHGSEVVNNPYRAGLDCGACGGHSGEPNARVAAALFNEPAVRRGLRERGIDIPDDTVFVAAVHVTTTDEIRFFEEPGMPERHGVDMARLRRWTAAAGAAARLERAPRLGLPGPMPAADRAAMEVAESFAESDILRRSRDWSEVRPEWGLAGNAAFIVAPRKRTRGLDLGGRAFLHDYDHARDPDGKVLELILTAPMIVTSWINLQYYASAVDNRAFGSGNKTIHNVTGQFGVLLGNGGDLMTGLPWQSVSDGRKLQHEPLRLSVIIDAPRRAVQDIIERHAVVRDLAGNGWLTILAWEGESLHRWSTEGEWRPERHLLDL